MDLAVISQSVRANFRSTWGRLWTLCHAVESENCWGILARITRRYIPARYFVKVSYLSGGTGLCNMIYSVHITSSEATTFLQRKKETIYEAIRYTIDSINMISLLTLLTLTLTVPEQKKTTTCTIIFSLFRKIGWWVVSVRMSRNRGYASTIYR